MTGLLALALLSQTPLDAYIAAPDTTFAWKAVRKTDQEGGVLHLLELTSQTWHGTAWKHALELYVPPKAQFPTKAALIVTGDRGRHDQDLKNAYRVARQARIAVAVLYDVPNQPLLGGLREDELIAHTFEEFLRTGDASWPLLFPMAKSAMRAMDALSAYTAAGADGTVQGADKSAGPAEKGLTSFILVGASKRGWAAYLTAAADKRVIGLAPMAFDMLDFPRQLAHQKKSWGRYSRFIEAYTKRGLTEVINGPRGRELVEATDPYAFRRRIAMPKLIVLGANDPFWTTDALNLYWPDLVGPRVILYAPNSGHGLDDRDRVLNALAAFLRLSASGQPLPYFRWTWMGIAGEGAESAPATGLLRLKAPGMRKVRLWMAESATRDFSASRWRVVTEAELATEFAPPETRGANGFRAIFGEVDFELDGIRFSLSTQPAILRGR